MTLQDAFYAEKMSDILFDMPKMRNLRQIILDKICYIMYNDLWV